MVGGRSGRGRGEIKCGSTSSALPHRLSHSECAHTQSRVIDTDLTNVLIATFFFDPAASSSA